MGKDNQYIFSWFFTYRGDEERLQAEKQREDSLVYLKRIFKDKANFSCIAKDESSPIHSSYVEGVCTFDIQMSTGIFEEVIGKVFLLYAFSFGGCAESLQISPCR